MFRFVVNFWPCDAFLQAPFWNWQTVLISNVNYIITRVLCWAATIIISEWMKFITFALEWWLLCSKFRLKIYEKHQWCDLFWWPLALHKWNVAVTSRTWSAAHASRRSFSRGSKTGLDKKAEIERKTCCDKIYRKMLMLTKGRKASWNPRPRWDCREKRLGYPCPWQVLIGLWHSGG